jgi:hypothetical protein
MSNPKCCKCSKTVYVTEKLDCLNKGMGSRLVFTRVLTSWLVWHKGCFRCDTCNQVLNLKTYQSTGGKPYCKVGMALGAIAKSA